MLTEVSLWQSKFDLGDMIRFNYLGKKQCLNDTTLHVGLTRHQND